MQEGVAGPSDFNASQDPHHFALINLGLVASDLIEFILKRRVLLYLLG